MKKIHLSADIKKLMSRTENMRKANEMIETEFVECMKLVETKSDMSFIIKDSEKTVEELKRIEKEIEV